MNLAGLSVALEARATPEGLAWLREASAAVAADATAVRTRFPMAGRKVGRGPLEEGADPADLFTWTIDDAARVLLLVATGEAAEGELAELYRYGDAAERRGVHEHLMFGEGELDLDEALSVLTEIEYQGLVAVELSRHSHAAHEMVPAAKAALRVAEREVVG